MHHLVCGEQLSWGVPVIADCCNEFGLLSGAPLSSEVHSRPNHGGKAGGQISSASACPDLVDCLPPRSRPWPPPTEWRLLSAQPATFASIASPVALGPLFSHWPHSAHSEGYSGPCFDLTTARRLLYQPCISPIHGHRYKCPYPSLLRSSSIRPLLPSPAMPSYRTHITILQQIAAQHPAANAFQVPEFDPHTNQVLRWHPVTYSRFFQDVELFAKHWTRKLTSQGVLPRSVVGVW